VTRRELLNEPVDFSELAVEVVEHLRRQDGARDVDVEIEPGLLVTGDSALLELVAHNLIDNAWKFTDGTADARISLARLSEEDGRSTFVVRDNGAGFDMRYADKLFRPFERLHRQEEFSGTGVGLTTAARILSRHSGRIWAEGSPGDGASFFFELPTRKDHDA
jgi:light-regulated signal transduction histidine kinase (bacteriophytochrome)